MNHFLGTLSKYKIDGEVSQFYNFTTDFLLKMTVANLPITLFDLSGVWFCAPRVIHKKA